MTDPDNGEHLGCIDLVRLGATALGIRTVLVAAFEGDATRVVAVHPSLADPEGLDRTAGHLRDFLPTDGGMVVVDDPGAPAVAVPWAGTPRSHAGVALAGPGGEPRGLLWAFDDGPVPWDQARRDLLSALGAVGSALLCRPGAGPPDALDSPTVRRLLRLQRATRALSAALTPDEVLGAVVTEAVRALDAQHGTVVLADETGTMLQMRHIVGLPEDVAKRWHEFPLSTDVPLAEVTRTGRSLYIGSRKEMVERFPAIAREVEHSDRRAWVVAPIRDAGRGGRTGALMVSWTEPRAFTFDEHELVEAFAGLCGPVLQRAASYEQAAEVATALQTSLLPSNLPDVEGLEMHARYVPTGRGDVGGDWYDVVTLPDGRLGLIVGDVVGHGIWAAAQMGQIRHALRTLVFVEPDPLRALALFDEKVVAFRESVMATAIVMLLDLGASRLEYAEAGHLPPMIRRSDGTVEVLETAQRPPLGVVHGDRSDRGPAAVGFHRGDLLLVYTDGLVERRGEPIDEGLNRLRRVLAAARGDLPAVADRLAREVPETERRDDFALLLVSRR